jgi:hypothetical protein
MTASIPALPVDSPAAWRGCDLTRQTPWLHRLSTAERDELLRLAEALQSNRPRLRDIARADFSLPRVGASLRTWRDELRRGRGFVLVRGVPVDGLSKTELAAMYWLLGLHLGNPVPQNQMGELLCDVRDTGADPVDPDTRLYTTRAEQDFHTDGADIIGLLCLRGARTGGASRIVSSITVVNELARRHPRLVPLLFEPWRFRIPGEPREGFPDSFAMPICRWDGTSLSTFYIGWYIRRAQELPNVARLTDAQHAVLTAFEEIANDPDLYLDMDFEPGDIQWLKNSVILHKRTSYEDFPEPERKRHLLRLWLAAADFDDGDARLRRGMAPETPDAP